MNAPADLRASECARNLRRLISPCTKRSGANAKSISVAEVLPALNTGAVDGFDNTLFTQAASWHQAITHYTVTKHIYQPALLVVNLKFFNSLPPELQSVLIPSDKTLEARGRKGIRALEPLLLKNLSAQKITVTELSKEQLKTFETASRLHGKRGFQRQHRQEKAL